MNILLCINEKFIDPAIVSIFSLADNHKQTHIRIYIMHSDLTADSMSKFSLNFQSNKFIITEFIKVDNSTFFSNLITNNSRWPIEVFYRIFSFYLLPSEVDRILYIDADTIIDKDISEFYNSDFRCNYLIACEDPDVMMNNDYYIRIKSEDSYIYFNSGVLIFNLSKLRDNMEKEKIETLIMDTFRDLVFPDQDLLNILFKDNVLLKDYRKYNFLCDKSRYTRKQFKSHVKHARIFHFGGGVNYKPWHYKYHGTLKNIWWKYAKKTTSKKSYIKTSILNALYQPLFYINQIKEFIKKVIKHLIKQ